MNTVTRNGTNCITAFMLEARVIAGIALPLILASLVNMSISITDVVMMGWLGTSSLAAGAIVSDYYSIFFYFCSGILAASSPLIARAIGESRYSRIGNIVQQALLLALSLSLPGALIVYNADVPLHMIGIKQEIIETGLPYARIMAVTFTVMLLVNVLHHFLAAHQKTRVILLITALSMPLNALGNYMFMFGYADIEPMGLAGAAMSSCITAVFILAGMIIYIARSRAFADYSIVTRFHRKNMTHIKEILRIGLPIGISNLGEMGVFLFSTVTMGVFGADVLASHTVTLRMAGVVFALPMGFAQAATVRVAFALGKNASDHIMLSVKTALVIALGCGLVVLTGLIGFSAEIIRAFISGPVPVTIMNQAALFLVLLAIGEPFTNLGSVSAGILRAYKDTRVPMLISLAAYWAVAFLGGWSAAFIFHLGATAIWAGLTSGCIVYGILMALRLHKHFAAIKYSKQAMIEATA